MADQDTYLLLYTYVEDMAERRGPYREEHLAKIRAAREAGHITLAGEGVALARTVLERFGGLWAPRTRPSSCPASRRGCRWPCA